MKPELLFIIGMQLLWIGLLLTLRYIKIQKDKKLPYYQPKQFEFTLAVVSILLSITIYLIWMGLSNS